VFLSQGRVYRWLHACFQHRPTRHLRPCRTDQPFCVAEISSLISPIFGDLNGLPPLLIQVGSHEILLSDALRLAQRAATSDVAVTLDVTPGAPHVFQGFAGFLDEARAALDRAADFVKAQLG
jgi:acetyl esterase/lipase